jgi:SET domain
MTTEAGISKVEVIVTSDYGKAVVAKVDLTPGTLGVEIFREEALIIFPPHDMKNLPPWGRTKLFDDRAWSDYQHFLKQPEDVQEKVLSFYAEMDSSEARMVKTFVLPYFGSPEEAHRFTHLLMVVKFNSVTISPTKDGSAGGGHYLGHGLFEVACRMAHSCKPNATWFTSQDGRYKIIRAIEPIQAGELVTITYLDHKVLEQPMYLRRGMLKRTKNFDCICPRCVSETGDDTRLFSCSHSNQCIGHHFVKQVNEDDIPEFLPCSSCGLPPKAAFQEAKLATEKTTLKNITYVDYVADNGLQVDITRLLRSLKPPSPRHALTLPIYRAQSELFEQTYQTRGCQGTTPAHQLPTLSVWRELQRRTMRLCF